MELQNEYLIIIDKETNSGFYSLSNSIERFNEFIENEKILKIRNNKVEMDNHNSSDADLFIGKEDLYQKIDTGKWKLR